MSETKLSSEMEFLMRQPYIGGEDVTAPSELAPSEPQARSGRCAGATGSISVSSAEALCDEWEKKARELQHQTYKATSIGQRERLEGVSDCLWHVAAQLRRQAEAWTERQPESNVGDQPRADDGLPPRK